MNTGIVRAGALASIGFALLTAEAPAATFHVTRTGDPNPNGCNQGGCSLREATLAANNRDGADVIVLESGKAYKMDIAGAGEDEGLTGDFDLTGKTTVRASGNTPATVDAKGIDGVFNAFADARFERLTLVRADFNAIHVEQGDGLALRTRIEGAGNIAFRVDDGDATMVDSRIEEPSGNGIYQFGPGSVRIEDTDIIRAGSTAISEYEGGSVRVGAATVVNPSSSFIYESDDGSVEVDDSTVEKTGSTAISEYLTGNVVITRSKFSRVGSSAFYESDEGNLKFIRSSLNRAQSSGFSEYDAGNVEIQRSQVRETQSSAVYEANEGGVEVSGSSIRDTGSSIVSEYDLGGVDISRSRLNKADSSGIYESGEGGVKLRFSVLSDLGSTALQENDPGGLELERSSVSTSPGVGAFVNEGDVRLVDSTIQDHGSTGLEVGAGTTTRIAGSTIARNGSPAETGGGVYTAGALRVENSTIFGNVANNGGGLYVAGGTAELNAVTITRNEAGTVGGGLEAVPAGVEVRNSILADNVASTFGPDCYASVSFTSGGHNLLSDDDFCTGLGAGSDKIKENAKTGSLENNGGPTRTAAISKNSPAVDSAGNSSPSRDQRGRKRDSKPDIGAYER